MVGFSGHPYRTPQDPGREAESPGSGLPLQKYRRGRGSSRELSQRLSSQRNSFQGNVSLSPSTEEPSLSALQQSWTLDLSIQGFPQHGLFFFAAASLRTDAAVGRSGRVSTHTVSCYNPNIHENSIQQADDAAALAWKTRLEYYRRTLRTVLEVYTVWLLENCIHSRPKSKGWND